MPSCAAESELVAGGSGFEPTRDVARLPVFKTGGRCSPSRDLAQQALGGDARCSLRKLVLGSLQLGSLLGPGMSTTSSAAVSPVDLAHRRDSSSNRELS